VGTVWKARVTSKAQITVPRAVRAQLGIQPGDDVALKSVRCMSRCCRRGASVLRTSRDYSRRGGQCRRKRRAPGGGPQRLAVLCDGGGRPGDRGGRRCERPSPLPDG